VFLIGFPLLLIPFAIYNMVAFLLPGIGWTQEMARIHMVSGADWTFTPGELLISIGVVVLFFEMLKATRLSTRTIVDHVLSTLLFIGMIVEFLLVKQAASGTFFLLLVISFVDVAGGFTITIRTAQRDITVEEPERHAAA
jgi:uncharacterized membrane protein YdcZ (DUF606 family)